MIDQLNESVDRVKLVQEHCQLNKNASYNQAAGYEVTKCYMLHVPGLGRAADGAVSVVALKMLPPGVEDLSEYLMLNFESHAVVFPD